MLFIEYVWEINVQYNYMTIYFLRHEERPNDITFLTELTETGVKRSKQLGDRLKKLNITKIYCSPFLRTLQTIKPFIKKNNLSVNVDYSISELYKHDIIPKELSKSFIEKPDITVRHDWFDEFNISYDYTSIINNDKFIYPESISSIKKRIFNFADIRLKSKDELENILICTHHGVLTYLIPYLYPIINKNDEVLINYPMGGLSHFNNGNLSFI